MSYRELRVIDLTRKGLTPAQIAGRLGCTTALVYAYRHKHALNQTTGRARHEALARGCGFADRNAALRAWAADGLTNAEMGARLGGIAANNITACLRAAGVPPRQPGRPRGATL